MFVCMFCMCLCICLCICLCMCLCMCVCVCMYAFVFVFLVTGIFTLVFLFLMPVLVLRSLWGLKKLNIHQKTIKETLVAYNAKRKQLLYLQQVGIYACFVLMFTIMPVTSKIMSNKDFFAIPRNLGFYVGIGLALIFLFFYARWGYGCYKKITNSAENLLKGLE